MSKILDIANKLAAKLSGEKPSGQSSELSPIEESRDQSPDEQKLVAYIKEKIESARSTNSRITMEGTYLTNVAYLLGFDGVFYDTAYRQFRNVDPKRKLSRNRFRVNKILPTVQNRLSRLTQSPPRFDVRPNSNSTEDKDAARLGLEIITDVLNKQRFDEKRQELFMLAMQGGVSYAQVHWDPCLGKPMYDPETNEMVGYEGDIRIDILNALQVFPDPLAKHLEDAQWIIKAIVRKLDYFQERYPERGKAVKEEQAWLVSSLYDMKSNALTGVGITGASTQDQMKNSAIELVYYEKRSKDHPNGRMVVCANGVLLEDKELPIGEYDIVKFDDIVIGGRYNAEAIITHLRPIQDQYTIARTKMAEHVRKLLAGKWIAAKGANLSQESINNDIEIIEHTPVPNASEPKAAQIPPIPPYAYKELDTMKSEFNEVSGINEVSQGVLPSASIPASGMAFLQEQDQTRIGVQTSRNEVGFAKIGQCILKYASQYYEMPRLLKEAGDGLEYAVKDFVGADLRDNHDVICVPGSTIPQSKVLRRQDILNAFNMGLLGDPSDPKLRAKVLDELEYGDTAEMWKMQALKDAQSKKIISLIEEGNELEIQRRLSEKDDQAFLIQRMEEYRLSDKYWELDENKRKIFDFVMEWRINALNQIMNPQIPQQQMLADQMMKTQNEQFAQQHAHLAAGHPGAPGNLGGGPPPLDKTGNPIAPPPAQAPIPNVMPLKHGA